MARPARLRRDLLTAAGTLTAALLLYPRVLLRGESFYERDLLVDWYQRMAVLERCLREHAWPLWDPTIGFGYPLLADPGSQILYPPAWIAFAFPKTVGYAVFAVGHLLLGSLGTRRLATALGAGPWGAATAGVVWALSGPIQSSLNLRHHLAAAAWLPWLLLLLERLLRRPGWRGAVALGGVAALQVLAGSPDVSAFSAVAATGWVLVRTVRRRPPARAALTVAAAALLAAGLSAAQWWPALDVLSRSARLGMPDSVRVHWSLPPLALVRLVAPLDSWRVPFTERAWTELFDAPERPFLPSVYLGLPVLVTAAAAFASASRRRTALGLLVLALAGIGYAMGPHAPVYGPATASLGLLRLLRYPSKALLVTAPFVGLLAGLGVSRVIRQPLTRPWAAAVALMACGLAGVAAAAGLAFGSAGWVPLVSLLAVFSGALLAGAHRRVPARVVAWALPVLCAGDLVAAHAELNATAPLAALLAPPPTVALVDRSESRRLYVYDYHAVAGAAARLLGRAHAYLVFAKPAGAEPRLWQALAQQLYLPPPRAGLFGLENSFDTDLRGLYPAELDELTFGLRQLEGTPIYPRLLGMGAVGTVFSLHRSGLEGLRLERMVPTWFAEPLHVWRVPGARPRSWLVGCARAADGEAAPRALTDPGFDPAVEVVLPTRVEASAGQCGASGSSRIVALHPDRVVLEARATRPGFLVLADAYDPGWTASVDGRSAPVLRANVAFRAVAVPAGAHRVEMVYRPRAVSRGAALSMVTLLGVAALWAAAARRGVTRGRAGSAEPVPR